MQTPSAEPLENGAKTGSAGSPFSPPTPHTLTDRTQTNFVLLDVQTKANMLACARGSETFSGVGRESDFATLDDYLKAAPVVHGGDQATQDLLIENLELSSPNRGKIRVRFSPRNETSKNTSKTEVFGVDSDGLPVLIPFPHELEGLSQADQLAKLKQNYETLNFDQKTVAFRWSNGASGTVSFRNGQIQEMQLYFENRGSMGCAVANAQVNCTCLKPAGH